jgi:Na+/glutamate symporter
VGTLVHWVIAGFGLGLGLILALLCCRFWRIVLEWAAVAVILVIVVAAGWAVVSWLDFRSFREAWNFALGMIMLVFLGWAMLRLKTFIDAWCAGRPARALFVTSCVAACYAVGLGAVWVWTLIR